MRRRQPTGVDVELDVVLDPFAGYGTTLSCAERLGHAGYGIERDARH